MKRIVIVLYVFCFYALCMSAQEFNKYFENNTLRIDYIMGGDCREQYILFEQMYKDPVWAGRKRRLSEMFLQGNGQIKVFDKKSRNLIYVHTFSTLFQEWLKEKEATQIKRAFEVTFNLPFPKNVVDIEVTLMDNHNKIVSSLCHTVDPKDILIRDKNKKSNSSTEYKYLVKNGNVSDCVDVAIVAEGYAWNEKSKFFFDAQRAADALLEHEPFSEIKDKFNIVAVAPLSSETGTSIPHDKIWKRTALNSHYDTFYTDRYLTIPKVHYLYEVLSGIPYEHIIVLVNTDAYGGGGIYNQWMTITADHSTFKRILVHEFGHSYAGLADEYSYSDNHDVWYPADTEPWEPNITTLVDFEKKWKNMLAPDTPVPTPCTEDLQKKITNKNSDKLIEEINRQSKVVGVYEGAGYQEKGVYRPAMQCRMRINEVESFCPVCTKAIKDITDFYTAK